jgi:hypothetical protein
LKNHSEPTWLFPLGSNARLFSFGILHDLAPQCGYDVAAELNDELADLDRIRLVSVFGPIDELTLGDDR